MTKCALIGCGYWGSKLKRYLDEDDNLDLAHVCDSKSDLIVIWDDPSIEAVIIATPVETHYELTKSALLAGKHVLCEKPLTPKVAECEELREIAQAAGLTLMVDYTWTFSPGLRWLQKKLRYILSIEMNFRQLGRFGRGDVYWLLGSHTLAILDMFVPLKKLKFIRHDLVRRGDVQTGLILFDGAMPGKILVSLDSPVKEKSITFYLPEALAIYDARRYCSVRMVGYDHQLAGRHFDEGNNLRHVLHDFARVIGGGESDNLERAIEVTRILEEEL